MLECDLLIWSTCFLFVRWNIVHCPVRRIYLPRNSRYLHPTHKYNTRVIISFKFFLLTREKRTRQNSPMHLAFCFGPIKQHTNCASFRWITSLGVTETAACEGSCLGPTSDWFNDTPVNGLSLEMSNLWLATQAANHILTSTEV